jgi:glycerol transport system substrate-binding protein
MNEKTSAEDWFAKAESSEGMLAPQRKLENEKPQGETVAYEDLLEAWSSGKAMPDTM